MRFNEITESSSEDRFKKYIRPVVKTTPKIEKTTNPSGRTTDHIEWKVTGDTGEIRRFKSKKEAQEYYDLCTKKVTEAGSSAQQAAIAIAMKKAGKKPKNESYTVEDEQIDGMAQGEIREIIKNAVHIKNQLDDGVSLDGWMYSYVTTSNDHLNSVAEQINNPNIDEQDVAEGSEANDDVVSLLNSFGYYSDNSNVYINDDGDKIARQGSNWKHQSGPRGTGAEELEDFLSSRQVDEGENWSKHNNPRAGGMSKKSVSSYRRSHPGSKIQTAVTTKPSKLKKGSKAAKRRASFCARMRGMKKHRTGAKTANDPNSNINKSLRRWHCESIEELHELVMLAEQFIQQNRKTI